MSIDNQEGHKYTIGQTAQFFGVSIATIHHWIQGGRLVGAEQQGTPEVQIPDSATWITSSGHELSVKEVVRLYRKELKSRPGYPATTEEEKKAVTDELGRFERKYGHSFAETFGQNPPQQQLSGDEQRDAEEWSYWLQRLERLNKE